VKPSSPLDVVARNYSFDAEIYEKSWAPVLRPHSQALLERLPLGHAARVLDAGAGVGFLLPDIQARAASATVFAVDCSAGMLARAPACFPRALMDVMQLGFAPASFDVVIMAFILFHTQEPLLGLREARRILRQGGVAGTITWDGEPNFPAQKVFTEELDASGAVPDAAIFTNHEPVCSPERISSLFTAAGFEDIHTWAAPFDHQYQVEEFINIRTSRGSTRRRFESLDEVRRALFLDRVRRRFDTLTLAEFIDQATLIYATGQRG
jgi:ubiquinone/menaquinone biosynthesis C-methylase UbiE